MIAKIKQAAKEQLAAFIKVRRHLHANPELSFKEYNTCAYIKEYLQKIKVDEVKQIGKTGVLGIIKGNSAGKTILLRADMDALPINTELKTAYKSQTENVMHACGHDVHMATLLFAAFILNSLKKEFSGTIRLLFQPAEEKMPGGATEMISNGVLENPVPHAVLGQHVFPQIPVGKVGFKPGKFMASMDEIYITVKGKGGHGAMPETTIDPIFIACQIVTSAQQLVSRVSNPNTPTVLSFGKIMGNGSINVIPNEVYLEGTFRTVDEVWRKEALAKLKKLVTSIAEGLGGSCEIKIKNGYPFVFNNEALTNRAKLLTQEYVGKDNVLDQDIWMASEDFAYYSHLAPSTFYLLGVKNEAKGINSGLHTPTFDIDERALETGAGLMAWLAVNELKG
ncbi:N-acetyl-L,L-diaminopimelate deacetylase [hydrothermal vent metagenome]|uniref:N-acetyl-L,L-diaminopimelate deacetylase n=1 Tax=hydrothermal vent metagenome TaxID=652676 RepID=A0A3B0V9C4_9ZZZZ